MSGNQAFQGIPAKKKKKKKKKRFSNNWRMWIQVLRVLPDPEGGLAKADADSRSKVFLFHIQVQRLVCNLQMVIE